LADRRGPRLAVLDDGLFVRTAAGGVRPVAATFNTFVEAVARTGEFRHARYMIPVRDARIWETESPLQPVDESLVEIVPTTWFSGIADYVLRAGYIAARNWMTIDRAVATSDLVWLRLPASNALLALAATRRHRVAHFGWVAGSVSAVAASGERSRPMAFGATALGRAYDAVTQLVGRTGPLIELDGELFASVFTDDDVATSRLAGPRAGASRRIVWSGRMAAEKGLVDLIDIVSALSEGGRDVTLVVVGDGPERHAVEAAVARAGLPRDRVELYGHVGDRGAYMALLRGGDVFVHPSRAEGVPKTIAEAMAAGLPVVATDVGNVRGLLGDGERGVVVPAADRGALVAAVGELLDDAHRHALRERGLDWAAAHTAEAQAARLVERLRRDFPDLPWPA
jgi:Glycosyl transferases group 1